MRLARLAMILFLLAGCATAPLDKEDKEFKIADTKLKLGIGYLRQGKLEYALEALQGALAAEPGYAEVHSALALVYERLLKYDDADDHYREAIDLKPEDGGVYNNYGVFLCKRGKYVKADSYFNKAIEVPRYKTPEGALENAGACAKQIPDLEKAEVYLRKALSINSKLPLALSEMAGLMFTKEKYMSTRAYLQRYEEVAKHSARTLWLGIRTERKLGDKTSEARYAKLLQTQYPDSLEFKRWLEETP